MPLLVQFPEHSQPRTSAARVMLIDLFSICLNSAGAKRPETDGRDLRLSLEDGGHPFVFSENEGLVAISDGRHKYIQFAQAGREVCEAYDLQEDPHEFNNVVAQPSYARDVSRLRGMLAGVFMRDFLR